MLWKPSLFGAKPEMIVKGGQVAWSQMGDPNASIPTPEPVEMRVMFAGKEGTRAAAACSVAFVSGLSLAEGGPVAGYGLNKRWVVFIGVLFFFVVIFSFLAVVLRWCVRLSASSGYCCF